jgi:hypothetical protein
MRLINMSEIHAQRWLIAYLALGKYTSEKIKGANPGLFLVFQTLRFLIFIQRRYFQLLIYVAKVR